MHGFEGDVLELLRDVLTESVEDTLVLIPFLYLTYLAMEALEHGAAGWSERIIVRAGKAGPVLGALLGALPQCGFSAMGATLYAGRVVTLGTLIAVVLSTSDEMLPVFIANGAPVAQIVAIVGFKVAIGMVAGLLVDLSLRVFRIPVDRRLRISELCEKDGCDCGFEELTAGQDEALAEKVYEDDGDLREAEGCAACGHHEHHGHHEHGAHHHHGSIWRSALVHTVQVTVFIFLVTLVLELVIESVGTDVFAQFMLDHPEQSVFVSALVGLVPNCAASVVISELYLEGALGSGAMIAGLLTGAGVGLLVLFRANRPLKQNVGIVAVLYGIGVLCGLIVTASGFTF